MLDDHMLDRQLHIGQNDDNGTKPAVPSIAYEGVEELIRTGGLRLADFWFTDLAGRTWRITMPTEAVTEDLFLTGLPLDGQPIGGSWDGVMLLLPQRDAVYRDPAASSPTLAMICDVLDPLSHEPLILEPRHVLKRAVDQIDAQLGATVTVGAEPEFMLMEEGHPASEDLVRDYLRGFARVMGGSGIQVDWFRTGPASGQGRIQIRSGPALQMADRVLVYRQTARALARRSGLTLSFLPRPVAGDGTLGMAIHQTLWKNGHNLFHDDGGWALTSALCRWYAGGILAHIPALLAFCAPTTNSYRRLIPGLMGPTDAFLSTSCKTAACRIPARSTAPGARRVKFCSPDPMANPYLAFAAVMLAGLDGINRQMEPTVDGAPTLYTRFPHCLEDALEALDTDRGFLTRENVFSNRLIDAWIEERWDNQVVPARSQPHPWELSHADSLDHSSGDVEAAPWPKRRAFLR